MASGPVCRTKQAEHIAAPTNAANVKKVLANSEPSTHGTKRHPLAHRTCPLLGQSGHDVIFADATLPASPRYSGRGIGGLACDIFGTKGLETVQALIFCQGRGGSLV